MIGQVNNWHMLTKVNKAVLTIVAPVAADFESG